jgi:hypothetical protein
MKAKRLSTIIIATTLLVSIGVGQSFTLPAAAQTQLVAQADPSAMVVICFRMCQRTTDADKQAVISYCQQQGLSQVAFKPNGYECLAQGTCADAMRVMQSQLYVAQLTLSNQMILAYRFNPLPSNPPQLLNKARFAYVAEAPSAQSGSSSAGTGTGTGTGTGQSSSQLGTGQTGSQSASGQSGSQFGSGQSGSQFGTGQSGSQFGTGQSGSQFGTGQSGSQFGTGQGGQGVNTGAGSMPPAYNPNAPAYNPNTGFGNTSNYNGTYSGTTPAYDPNAPYNPNAPVYSPTPTVIPPGTYAANTINSIGNSNAPNPNMTAPGINPNNPATNLNSPAYNPNAPAYNPNGIGQ